MQVMHIAGGAPFVPLFERLFRALCSAGIDQTVVAATRPMQQQRFDLASVEGIRYVELPILGRIDRVLFRRKIERIEHAIAKNEDVSRIELVHAHSLHSDGGAAYALNRTFAVPYIVAVRNTDIHFFGRYRPDLREYRQRVLGAAKEIVLISPAYRTALRNIVSEKTWRVIESRIVVVPNGIDDFWHEESHQDQYRTTDDQLRIVFVGSLLPGKNIPRLLAAIRRLNEERPAKIAVVGDAPRRYQHDVDRLKSEFRDIAAFLGRIGDLHELRDVYRQHDIFAMPSLRETFGLVYIEALSQGLPVLHSRGEGIDGFFPPCTVAEAVDPRNVDAIAGGIRSLADRREALAGTYETMIKPFRWETIAQRYAELYRERGKSGVESTR